MPNALPIRASDRIASLDVLRGFALVGILVMNIQVFSMPAAAYTNPTVWGGLSGADLAVWLFGQLFVNQKFLFLFSLLFGAGICLFADRIEARGGRPAPVHYRRMAWLLVFGLAHAYLLWIGDILVPYAVCGSFLWLARRLGPRALLVLGLAVFSAGSGLQLLAGAVLSSPAVQGEARREIAAEWTPSPEELEVEVAAYGSGWAGQQPLRVEQSLGMHLFMLPFFSVWFVGGAMLFGMALYRLGILGAAREDGFYRRLAAWGLLVGAPVTAFGIGWNCAGGWNWERSMFFGAQFDTWGSPAMALGYLGLVLLVVRRGLLPGLLARLAAAGRMAFTNYLLQTVICTTIFYGHGLGLFGRVDRAGQLGIAAAVVLIQLWLSPLWLGRFAYGPLEWAWRGATYGRAPPLRRSA